MHQNRNTVILLAVVFTALGILAFTMFFPNRPLHRTTQPSSGGNSPVIATVGAEQIFQSDLDTELSYTQTLAGVDTKKIIMDKLISDSIVLQAAAAEGLITLDASVYNSTTKDYMNRINLVETAKKEVSSRADQIQGTVITIWFFNNEYVGPRGYEKSKRVAFEKIQELYTRLTSQTITLKELIETIKNDTSLAELDKAYKTNASFDFTVTKNKTISFDKNFDAMIWAVEPGQFSKISVLKDMSVDIDPSKEVAYAFAYVSHKKTGGEQNFEDWIIEKEKTYPVTYP